MFSCRDAAELMTDAQEGALTGFQKAFYAFHMTICPYCKIGRKQLEQAVGLAREIPPEEVPAGVEQGALDAFRRRSKPREKIE